MDNQSVKRRRLNIERTTNLQTILDDFGNFPENAQYNPFGLFYNNNHCVSVYLGTNYDLYFAIQCETPDCVGFGHNTNNCPYMQGRQLCFDYDNLKKAVETVLDAGFAYQPVYNDDGRCVYFEDGKRVRISEN